MQFFLIRNFWVHSFFKKGGGENCPSIALPYKLFSGKPNYLVIQLIASLSAERSISPFRTTLFKVMLREATSRPLSEGPPATAPRAELRWAHNLCVWQDPDAEVPLLKIPKCYVNLCVYTCSEPVHIYMLVQTLSSYPLVYFSFSFSFPFTAHSYLFPIRILFFLISSFWDFFFSFISSMPSTFIKYSP